MSTNTLTHALTVHQPFAWALAAGHKPVENRTWRPPLEMVGKLIGIHAGKVGDGTPTMSAEAWKALPSTLPRGALIGVARLVGVVRQNRGLHGDDFVVMHGRSAFSVLPPETCERIRPWWRGPWGWLLEEAVLLPEPIPMRGQQGLWRLPDVVIDGMPFAASHSAKGRVAACALEQWRKAREVVR